jgi:hypothetical protein
MAPLIASLKVVDCGRRDYGLAGEHRHAGRRFMRSCSGGVVSQVESPRRPTVPAAARTVGGVVRRGALVGNLAVRLIAGSLLDGAEELPAQPVHLGVRPERPARQRDLLGGERRDVGPGLGQLEEDVIEHARQRRVVQ